MKKCIACAISLLMLLFIGCQPDAVANPAAIFHAEILEITGDSVLVLALEGEDIRRSSDKISFSKNTLTDIDAEVGDIVAVTYSGEVMESYPAQVKALDWRIHEKAALSDAVAVTPTPDPSTVAEYNADGISMRVELPQGWSYSEGTQYETTVGLTLWPENDPSMRLCLEYYPSGIAICGTGVTFTDMAFANGLTATACTEQIGDEYSFLLIYDAPAEKYAVSSIVPMQLWTTYEAEVLSILETVEIG